MRLNRGTWKLLAPLLLIGLLATTVMMLTLAEVHEHIAGKHIMRWDERLQEDVHDDASPRLTRDAFALSRIGSPTVLLPILPAFAALLWWRGLRNASIVWLLATGGAGVLVVLLKLHFRRVRPDLPWAFAHEPTYSFPSGHSVLAVAVYGTLIHLGMRHLPQIWQRVAVLMIAGGLILGIGLSRIYLGVHYPSDVAAGYYVGAVWLCAVFGSDWYVRRYRAKGSLVTSDPVKEVPAPNKR